MRLNNCFVGNKEAGGITMIEIPPEAEKRERETNCAFWRRVGIFHPLNIETDDLPVGNERAENETLSAYRRRLSIPR